MGALPFFPKVTQLRGTQPPKLVLSSSISVYARRVDPSALSFSLSSHRHSYISHLFALAYRFINKFTFQKKKTAQTPPFFYSAANKLELRLTLSVYARRVDSSALVFSLSSHRHPFIGLVFNSRFMES
jgi:hypothetical protein